MTVVFDTYVPGTSLLHRLDPRVKLWGMVLSLMLVFLLPGPGLQALCLFVIHAVLVASGVPWRSLGRLWRDMAVLLALILLLQPFFNPSGDTLIAAGPVQLTTGGLANAVRLALRAVSIALVVAGLLFTTEHRTLIRALVRLGIPYIWGLTISLALRFLPAIQGLFHAVRDAQAARGWIPQGNLFRRLKDYIPILVAVLISTLRMSDDLTLALAARGLETTRQRTTWHELQMTARDWAFAAAVTVAFGLFLLGRVILL